jgi:putative phosphoribosyl transferase
MMVRRYHDRSAAGKILAEALSSYAGRPDAVVLGLPRGGVPVAVEIARTLGLPLDVFIVRKLGVPGHEELAMGAIASGGVRVLNHEVVNHLGLSAESIEHVARVELHELQRRELLYRQDRPPVDVRGRTVILVDDGLATGSTLRAAIAAVREQGAGRVIVAVPVAPWETADEFSTEVDELVCPLKVTNFQAVGLWYHHFDQVSDDEVRSLLAGCARA